MGGTNAGSRKVRGLTGMSELREGAVDSGDACPQQNKDRNVPGEL